MTPRRAPRTPIPPPMPGLRPPRLPPKCRGYDEGAGYCTVTEDVHMYACGPRCEQHSPAAMRAAAEAHQGRGEGAT